MKNYRKDNSVFFIAHKIPWWNIPAKIKRRCSMLKDMYYRAIYGFAPSDTYDLSVFISKTLGGAFRYLKENTHGYPIDMTKDEWDNYLNEISEAFSYAGLYDDEITDVAAEKWWQTVEEDKSQEEQDAAWAEYFKADTEFEERKQEAINKACDMMKARYFNFWD